MPNNLKEIILIQKLCLIALDAAEITEGTFDSCFTINIFSSHLAVVEARRDYLILA